jgi:DNA polymerase-3 subunit delta
MIIFLYGEDSYRIKEKEKEIVINYREKNKSGFDLRYFDFSKKDYSLREVFLDSSQESMFKEKKLYIVYNLFSVKEDFLKFIDKLQKSDNIFLIIEEKIDKKEKIFKDLVNKSSSQEFLFLTGVKLKNWIKKEFEKFDKKIEEKELNLFLSSTNNDLWLLSNEIKKIANFSEGKKIEEKDIKTFLKENFKIDIFKTIDAIAEKRKKDAIKLIRNHLENGENSLYLLSMIIYQFRNILIVKDFLERKEEYNNILKKTKMHPFVLRKTYVQSLKFTLEEIKKIYNRLVIVDLEIKTGKAEKETSLELFIANI